jgi:hypothetical protein
MHYTPRCVSLARSTPKSLYQALRTPSVIFPRWPPFLTRNRTAQQLLKARLNYRYGASMLERAGFHDVSQLIGLVGTIRTHVNFETVYFPASCIRSRAGYCDHP